jgi:aryl-alcohol dehydrogenase-like predicted oxidoreductase
MRYRPFGLDGRSISALTLAVDEEPRRPAERLNLTFAALEHGINAFELRGARLMESAAGLGSALAAVPREAVVVSLRLPPDPRHGSRPFSAEWVIHAVERTIHASGLEQLDLLILDAPTREALDTEARDAAESARQAGRVRMIGVAGHTAALDDALRWRDLDVLVAPYNLRSGWPERNRLAAAGARGLVVLGAGAYPPLPTDTPGEAGGEPPKRGLFGVKRRPAPLEKADGYAFLTRTRGWTPAELCLAYALTEPGLASVIVQTHDPKQLAGLAATPERDLPSGVPAQIEMARFAPV